LTIGAKADAAGVTAVSIAEVDTNTSLVTVVGSGNANNVTYTGSNTATVDISVTGGSGSDTFNTGTADNDSTFKGGSGTNTFNVKNTDGTGTHSTVIQDLKGSDVLTVGAGDTTVTVAVTADFNATSLTTNSSNSNADVVFNAGASKDINLANATVATGFTLNGSAAGGAEIIIGSSQADIINGKSGIDTLTGGAGADDFLLYNSATVDVVTDFTVAQTDQLGFDLSDLESNALTDLVGLDAVDGTARAQNVLIVNASAAVDLNGNDTDKEIALFSTNYADTTGALLQADIRANLTVAGTFAAGDAFLGVYDNGSNSFVVTIETAGGIDNTLFDDAAVTVIAQLTGLTDATTIADGNLFDMIA
jgi:Ca2+-binding RTX toxin-like protein